MGWDQLGIGTNGMGSVKIGTSGMGSVRDRD